MENNEKIYNLVDRHFGLSVKSLGYFKKHLFEPEIDETYKNILGDSKDLRRRWSLSNETENFDDGWKSFKRGFRWFVKSYSLSYKDFRRGKILINKNEIKLRKALISFYEKDINISLAIEDQIKCNNCRESNCCDINYKIDTKLENIGRIKFPKDRDLEVVLSLNFADWFLCSTSEGWDSCLKLTENGYCYWAGLPGLIGDKNRAMIYVTDKNIKQFEGIETEKIISRSWVLLDQEDKLNIVNWYPQRFFSARDLKTLTKVNFKRLSDNNSIGEKFKSKREIRKIWHANSCSSFIYMDGTSFRKEDSFLHGGGGGTYYWRKGNKFLDQNDLFHYEDGLVGLIKENRSVTYYEEENYYCDECSYSSNDEEYMYYFDNNCYCESCYNQYVRYCECCNRDVWYEDTTWIEDEERDVCNNCISRYYFHCKDCGYTCNNDDSHIIYDNRVCNNCFENEIKYFVCEECGEPGETEDSIEDNNKCYCKECAKTKGIPFCETCYATVNEIDLIELRISDSHICKRCLEKEVSKYQLNLPFDEVA